MALREILAEFGVKFDGAELEKGAATIDSVLDSIKGVAKGITGAFAVGAIWHFVTAATEAADATLKTAESLGISYVELKEWTFAADLSNVSAQALTSTLGKLSGGGKKVDKGLAAMGISAKNADGSFKSSTDLLDDIAEALSKIEDPGERNRKAMAVLGKQYKGLLPLLKDGAKGLKEMREEYHELGGGSSDAFAKQSEEFNDNLTRLNLILKTTKGALLNYLLPYLLQATQRLIPLAKHFAILLKNSKVLEAGLIALSARGILALSRTIGPLGAGLKMLSAQFFKVVLPLLILEDFLVFLAGGKSLFGDFVDKAFGKGTQEQVRKWTTGVTKDLQTFWKEQGTQKGKDDWELFRKTLNQDLDFPLLKKLGAATEVISQWLNPLTLIKMIWDSVGMTIINTIVFISKASEVLLDWLIPIRMIENGWSKLGISMASVTKGFTEGWITSIAQIHDAFIELWNGVITSAQAPLKLVGKVAGALGKKDAANSINKIVTDLEGQKGVPDAVATAVAQRENESNSFTNSPIIHIEVPAGTPADQARRVGEASKQGVLQAGQQLRDAKAAVTPGGGR